MPRVAGVCLLLVQSCNAQQQKFSAPLPRATKEHRHWIQEQLLIRLRYGWMKTFRELS